MDNNQKASQKLIILGDKVPGVRCHLSKILPWVRAAGSPYFDEFLRGTDIDAVLTRWLLSDKSEISLQRTRLLIADDDIAGGYITASGRRLHSYRQADLLDLARHLGRAHYHALRQRVQDLSSLFAPVQPDDLYLSKLGLRRHKRGQGLAHHLLEDCIESARDQGFRQIRLDVCENNEKAVALFESYGFEIDFWGHALASNLFYVSMKLRL